ncbi:PLP-dependent transferase [Sporosarcina siberiensis]|uniref:PLP-dependent transferase n=1 Tax=Sporosarcina siberiensis TaxID=1365606 RepID=A0ABW4SF52_9BACL
MVHFSKQTELVQIGNRKDEKHGAISTPIYLSTAYHHDEIGLGQGYAYSRTGSPTRDVLEEAVASLESGDDAFACSSGMSAVQLVFSMFEKDSHFIVSRDLYGGSYRMFELFERNYGFTFTYWDGREEEQLNEYIQENTKAVFLETPTNPLMQETDIALTAKFTERHELLLIVDNTFYTPYIQRPIEEGADVVIHSATKYLGGHNDILAGLVISKGEKLGKELKYLHNACGSILAPFDCWLLIRGLKTLALRMNQHEKNALIIQQFLEDHSSVTDVFYPRRGGMVSFLIAKEEWVSTFLKSLKLFSFAESLGGVESFITYPATQTHAEIPEDIRKEYGLTNCLLRISVGIEDEIDLVADLQQAFQECEKLLNLEV